QISATSLSQPKRARASSASSQASHKHLPWGTSRTRYSMPSSLKLSMIRGREARLTRWSKVLSHPGPGQVVGSTILAKGTVSARWSGVASNSGTNSSSTGIASASGSASGGSASGGSASGGSASGSAAGEMTTTTGAGGSD